MHGAVAQVGHAVVRHAQAHCRAVGQLHRALGIVDMHVAFGIEAGDGEILQLLAIGRFRHHVDPAAGQQLSLLRGFGRNAETQEHGYGVVLRAVAGRWMAAPVLQMTGLAGTRVVKRTQAVR